MRNATTTLSIEQFAHNIGAAQRLTLQASKPFADAFASADAEQQRDLRVRWMVGHIGGKLDVTPTRAATIREAGKGAGIAKAHIDAINCAYSDFRHHVARKSTSASTAVKHNVVVSRVQKTALMDCLACFEGETLKAQVQALRAALATLEV